MRASTYQPGVAATPVGVADDEGERVLVYRMGWGWVERRVDVVVAEVAQGEESAA